MIDDLAVQAWLEDSTTLREIEYVHRYFRLRADDRIQAAWFVLGVRILESMNAYGMDEEPEDENPELFPDPNDEDEPWKNGR